PRAGVPRAGGRGDGRACRSGGRHDRRPRGPGDLRRRSGRGALVVAGYCAHMTVGHRFDAARYLERIGYAGPLEPTYDVLHALQVAHMIHVPFENLDVYHRRGVEVGVDHSFHKIVERRRGGWCFEVNGGFAALLSAVGFDVDLLSCRTYEPDS